MFDRNELYRIYKFSLPIFDILVPYWNLYVRFKGIDVIKSLNFPEGFEEYSDKCSLIYHEHLSEIEKTEGDVDAIASIEETTYNQVLQIVTEYICLTILNNEQFGRTFKKRLFLILIEGESLLCITKDCDEEKMEELLISFLNRSNPIKILLNILDAENDTWADEMINSGLYDIAAKKAISSVDIRSMHAPIYCLSDLQRSLDGCIFGEVNSTNCWINYNLLNEHLNKDITEVESIKYFSTNSNESLLNAHVIILNDLVIPLISDFKKQYPIKMSGIWREFKSQVYHHKTNTTENTTRSANQNYFLQLTKDETFTDKLFYLEDNLFVPEEHFNKIQGLEEFFNDIIIVDGLFELDNYEFFSANIGKAAPFIGIHKKDKAGSQSYKLLHYLQNEGGKLKNYRGNNQKHKCAGRKAKILKPDIAFYYLLRFYEDFTSLALNEIRDNNKSIDFITNQNVSYNGQRNEIDVIAFNGRNIFIIELKTNLTIESIISFQKKCNRWLKQNADISPSLKFIIAGSRGKETLNICTSKVIEADDGVNNAPLNPTYTISVPLDNGEDLLCFTESSFTRLKDRLSQILITNETPNN